MNLLENLFEKYFVFNYPVFYKYAGAFFKYEITHSIQ